MEKRDVVSSLCLLLLQQMPASRTVRREKSSLEGCWVTDFCFVTATHLPVEDVTICSRDVRKWSTKDRVLWGCLRLLRLGCFFFFFFFSSCIPFPACDWTDSSSALNTNQQQGFHCIRGRACAQAHVFPSPVASSNAGEPVFFSPNKIINYFSATLAKSDVAPGGHTAVNIHSSCVGNLYQNKNIKMFFFPPLLSKWLSSLTVWLSTMRTQQRLHYTPMDASTAEGTDNSPSFPRALWELPEYVVQNSIFLPPFIITHQK